MAQLGLYDRAELQMRKALELLETQLGAEHPDTLTVAFMAGTLQGRGPARSKLRRCSAR